MAPVWRWRSRTGMDTEVGQIAATLGQMAERPTPFQVEVQKMARQMTVIVASLAVMVAGSIALCPARTAGRRGAQHAQPGGRHHPREPAHRADLCPGAGRPPDGPRKAVVRRLSVVESLGSVDTICTDKTGTLTQNLMTVQQLYRCRTDCGTPTGRARQPSRLELLRAGILCNEASILMAMGPSVQGDPVDTALVKAAQAAGLDLEQERKTYPR